MLGATWAPIFLTIIASPKGVAICLSIRGLLRFARNDILGSVFAIPDEVGEKQSHFYKIN
ncbi:MAG: hypothetical protein AMJ90_02015 [candidate division Zixibacteria bacterium SM23_73_2]|nr:MAG: hypothetical protein AMJ90_02015 [candidate division Zixibacteria bacterium SM23_73_2]